MQKITRRAMALMSVSALAACTMPQDVTLDRDDTVNIIALADAIKAMNPEVDPDEADRAAKIAYEHTHKLARQYQIEDPPLIHNAKVNRGDKPRGLCWHWADDMQARLAQENFATLDLHRAIANAFNPILIDHSTVIVSGPGDDMTQGIVIDPWRFGGTLFWSPLLDDRRYTWVPREEVFERKRAKALGLPDPGPRDPSSEPIPAGG